MFISKIVFFNCPPLRNIHPKTYTMLIVIYKYHLLGQEMQCSLGNFSIQYYIKFLTFQHMGVRNKIFLC